MPATDPCTNPLQYSVIPIFLSADTAFYYYNILACSPTSNRGYILNRTTDSFANWNYSINVNDPSGGSLIDVHFVDGTIGYIIVYDPLNSYLKKTTDGGNSWNVVFDHAFYTDLFFNKVDTGFVISKSGTLYSYLNGTIHLINDINFTQCYNPRMFFTENNFGYILAMDSDNTQNDKVLSSRDAGLNWSISLYDTSNIYFDIKFLNDTVGYLASKNGLFFTNDGGVNWTLLNTPFTLCYSISIVDTNTIYITAGGTVYYTNDSGVNWSSQILSANCYAINIKMMNDTLGFVYAQSTIHYGENLVLKTLDGGLGIVSINSLNNQLFFWPNPCYDFCEIEFPFGFQHGKESLLILYDVMGRIIQKKHVDFNGDHIKLDLHSIPNGIYFVALRDNKNNIYTNKLIRVAPEF